MKNIVITSVLLSAVVVATPAAAQDNSFSGLSVTALAGFDSVRVKDTTVDETESKNGFAYGGAVGYDYNLGSVVVGAEAELMGATTKYREQAAGTTYTLKAGRDIYLGARIGAPVTQNVLLYAKAGWTNARFTESLTTGATTLSESENLDGYRLGVGAEAGFNQLFGRVEYRFSDYGRQNDSDIAVKRHQVLVGVGYRF